MRQLVREYFDGGLSRRAFVGRLVAAGLTSAAAQSVAAAADLGVVQDAPAAGRGASFSGTGGALLVEQITAAGTRYVFTNPGSLEVAFFDALVDRPELELVVGLHEVIGIAIADGYHKASRQPAFVNVHAAVGTAQTAGQLYNPHFDGSGLVVTAGMSDNTIAGDDLVLAPRPGFSQSEINRQRRSRGMFARARRQRWRSAARTSSRRRRREVRSTCRSPRGPLRNR